MNPAQSQFTPARLAGLMGSTGKLTLPRSVEFMESPSEVLSQPQATTRDVLDEVLSGWLGEHYSTGGSTADTYASAVRLYLGWCSRMQVDPLLVRRPDASRFAQWLGEAASEVTGGVRSARSRRQILSACAALVDYAVQADVRPEWARNPFRDVKRPAVPPVPAVAPRIRPEHVNRMVVAAREDHLLGGVLGKLLVAVLARLGLRPGGMCGINVSGVRDDGHGGFELEVPLKGGTSKTRWLPPDMASDFYAYLHRARVAVDEDQPADQRGVDPLFVHPRRRVRVNTDDVLRLVRRSALRAGLPYGGELCSRHFRTFFATASRQAGSTLEERREGMGHVRAETTERYDRTEWSRQHDPAMKVSVLFEGYPAEDRTAPLQPADRRLPPRVEVGCECTPQWPELHVDLAPVGVDQTAVAVVAEQFEPGTDRLSPYCRKCRVAYTGPFRVSRVLDDVAGELFEQARRELWEHAAYPAGIERRDERGRE